jgi:ligand-binding sensor domain-containing protein/two-component sensor histidine kinase
MYSAVAIPNTNQITPSPLSSHISQPTITRIHRDSIGFMWIGTQQGLYRFDGSNVTKFDSTPETKNFIPNSDIRGISENTDGEIIVATFGGGLLKFDHRTQEFRRYLKNDKAVNLELTDLHKIGNDYHFAVSKSAVFPVVHRQESDYGWLNELLEKNQMMDIIAVVELAPSISLIANKNTLIEVDTKGRKHKSIKLEPKAGNLVAISKISDEEIVVGTSKGLVIVIDTSKYTKLRTLVLSDESTVRITSILATENEIWVGTDNGIMVIDSGLTTINRLNHRNSGLSHDYITRLFRDSEILFVGTYQGLDQINLNAISNYNSRNSGIYNDVLAFTLDRQERLWVGTYNGLFLHENRSGNHTQLESLRSVKLPDNRVMALEAENDLVWIGLQQHGLHRLNIEDLSLTSINDPRNSDLAVTRVLLSSLGELWVATYNRGIFRVENDQLVKYGTTGEDSFTLLLETSDGEIFAGTERKLYKYNENTNSFHDIKLRLPPGIGSPLLLSLSQDADKNIYIGTKDRGLYRWSYNDRRLGNPRATSFGEQAHTAGLTIYGMLFDRSGRMWCSTQEGVYVINHNSTIAFQLTKLDGLQANDFNFGAAYIGNNGDFYFGGVNGYNRLTPDAVKISRAASPMIISKIEIGGKPTLSHYQVSDLHSIRLTHDYNSLTIYLSLLDYVNPDGNFYEHRLQGFDDTWNSSGSEDNATYTNLRPGKYAFQARGRNTAGIYGDETVSINIVVLPPWWLTWWAYILYLILAMTALWGGLRFYRANLLKEAALKLADEMQDTADRAQDDLQESQDLQDELVRAVYQHNLTTLELIGKCIAASVDGGDSHPKLMDHLKAMELLEESYYFQGGQLMADLRSYVDRLSNHLLPQSTVAAATITTINLTTSEMLPARIASPVAIILYELVANALEHAFSSDVAAHYLEIKASLHYDQDDSFLSLSVADDGIGLPGAFTLGQSSDLSGLFVVKSLVDSLSGTIQLSTSGETRFDVSLPISH